MNNKQSILFICTHNSARSQMAEGLMREHFGDRFDCYSAGTEKTFVKPHAIAALQDAGIATDMLSSKTIDAFEGQHIDYVITVCDSAKETCPWFPANKQLIHAPFTDPSNEGETDAENIAAFCRVRDEIKVWLFDKFSV